MNKYEKKIPDDLDCGLTIFAKLIGAKWKACILAAIHEGHQRPSEIHRRLTAATPRVLDMQLRELEDHGLVAKNIHTGFPLKVEYFLTETGRSVLPVIDMMERWGDNNTGIVKQMTPVKYSVSE